MNEQNQDPIVEDNHGAFLARRAEKRRGRAHRARHEGETPLNLVAMIDMMTTIMFFLISSAVLSEVGTLDVTTARAPSAAAAAPSDDNAVKVPKVTVYISKDGFRLLDQTNNPDFAAKFSAPIERCGGGAADGGKATICARDGVAESEPLISRLDYASLYNQLVKIRLEPTWFAGFGKDGNNVVTIGADQEVPFEAIVKTIDTARFFLAPDGKSPPGEPSASSDVTAFLLGDGKAPTLETLEKSKYALKPAEGEKASRARYDLFPFPSLVAPRPAGG